MVGGCATKIQAVGCQRRVRSDTTQIWREGLQKSYYLKILVCPFYVTKVINLTLTAIFLSILKQHKIFTGS